MLMPSGAKIQPEKITHPLQLMAAWFVMIALLVSILLTAAAKLEKPTWAAGFLVISSVLLTVLVMVAVFLMLTTFRPHLQGPKEYAEWLKDERRFRGEAKRQIRSTQLKPPPVKKTTVHRDVLQEVISCPISLSYLPHVDEVLGTLRHLGFQVEIYEVLDTQVENREYYAEELHAAIWVGSRVPPRVALLAIKAVIDIWQHLKYLHLSSDAGDPPDHIHDQLYFGGATSTARNYNLKPWTIDEIRRIPDDISTDEFHKLIRAKYA